MNVVIVGNGKLAKSLLSGIDCDVSSWNSFDKSKTDKHIVVHVGSGRQIEECFDYCNKTKSIFLELATSAAKTKIETNFPIVHCPNTALPILKTMIMLKEYGRLFSEYKMKIVESHQSSKNTTAGTAVEIANSLAFPVTMIESIRDKEIQKYSIHIPEEYLNLHAYHKVTIESAGCEISIETKVFGHTAYVAGVNKIINSFDRINLEPKEYHIIDFIRNGWI